MNTATERVSARADWTAAVVAGLLCLLPAAFVAAAESGAAAITVSDAWAPATPPGARTAAVYLTLANRGGADRLLRAESDAAATVEFHTHVHRNGMMRMTELPTVDLPADATLTFRPHGDHLMLIDLAAPLVPGDRVTIALQFRDAGRVVFEAEVRDIRR